MNNEFIDVQGRLIIPPKNKMTGKLKVIAIGQDDLPSSIAIKRHVNVSGKIFVYSDFVIIDPSYPPTLGEQRRANLQVPYREDLIGNIKINPKNKMSGILDIVQKPKYKFKIYPEQEAFVREGIKTLNYGTEQTMLVGYNSELKEAYRSFIKFDISELPKNITIVDAKIGVYNLKDERLNHQIGLYTSAQPWAEYGVTWNSQPDIKELLDVQTVGREVGYREFDTTTKVQQWYTNEDVNDGFVLKALNETAPQFEQFYTRESELNKPYLEITYEENVIYSYGRSEISSSIFIQAIGDSNIQGSIKIRSFDEGISLPASIHIFNPDWFMESSIVVNRRELVSSIKVRQSNASILESSFTVRQRGIADPEPTGKIIVNKPSIPSRISIRYRNDVPSSLVVRGYGYARLESRIVINRREIFGQLRVRRRDTSDISGSITIGKFESNDIVSDIVINRREIQGHIHVVLSSYLPCSMTVVQHEPSDIESNIFIPYRSDMRSSIEVVGASMISCSIQILSEYFRCSISIPEYTTNDKLGRMTVRVKWVSDITSSIFVGGDNIEGGYVCII